MKILNIEDFPGEDRGENSEQCHKGDIGVRLEITNFDSNCRAPLARSAGGRRLTFSTIQ